LARSARKIVPHFQNRGAAPALSPIDVDRDSVDSSLNTKLMVSLR